jgi:hypothetical protein
MYVNRQTVVVTTDGSGNATAFTEVVTGRVISVQYVADGTVPYASTVDFTITAETTGQAILSATDVSASNQWAPRQPTHTTAGAASLYAAAGTAVNDHICLANERVKIVLAQGGSAKVGTFYVTLA